MLRAVLADEMRQGMNSRQALVAGRHAAPPLLFHVLEEAPNAVGRHLLDLQLIDRLRGLLSDEREQ
jgi:hypothetical protein